MKKKRYQFMDHDDLPQFDHGCAPRQSGGHQAPIFALPPPPPGVAATQTGEFSIGAFGEYYCGTDTCGHSLNNCWIVRIDGEIDTWGRRSGVWNRGLPGDQSSTLSACSLK